MFSDVQVKSSVGVVPVIFNPGHWKTIPEEADTVRLLVHSSTDFPDPAHDALIAEDEIFEEASAWRLKDLRSKVHRGPSTLQQV